MIKLLIPINAVIVVYSLLASITEKESLKNFPREEILRRVKLILRLTTITTTSFFSLLFAALADYIGNQPILDIVACTLFAISLIIIAVTIISLYHK